MESMADIVHQQAELYEPKMQARLYPVLTNKTYFPSLTTSSACKSSLYLHTASPAFPRPLMWRTSTCSQ